MINAKLFNPRDVLLIALVVVAWHAFATPLFNLIDGSISGTSDAE